MTGTQKVLVGTAVVAGGVGGFFLYEHYKAGLAGGGGSGSGGGGGSGSGGGGGTGTNCVEAYVGGGNPSPGYSGFCSYPDIVKEAASVGTAMVTRRCGYFWICVGIHVENGVTIYDTAEYYGGTTGGTAPVLIRVFPGTGNNLPTVGSWSGGFSC